MYIINKYKSTFEKFVEKVDKDNLKNHKDLADKISKLLDKDTEEASYNQLQDIAEEFDSLYKANANDLKEVLHEYSPFFFSSVKDAEEGLLNNVRKGMKERNEKSLRDIMKTIKDEVSIFKIYRLMN